MIRSIYQKSIFSVAIAALTLSCGQVRQSKSFTTDDADANCLEEPIENRILHCIPGTKIISVTETAELGRQIRISFEQPVDHFNPNSPKFTQVLSLLHVADDRPMVFATTGYSMYTTKKRELTTMLGANQIMLEHRFFGDSYPADRDWSLLSVKQSAYDFHRVIQAFKKIYKGPWINTGASKGGMTSVYTRRFFPNDLAATVAYVAPHSFSDEDPRYNTFIDGVGGPENQKCREDLLKFRREVLLRKEALSKLAIGKFTRLKGGVIGAIELGASEFRFVSWQYNAPAEFCPKIANTNVSDAALYATFNKISSFDSSYDDDSYEFFGSYYYQAAKELGAPAVDLNGIEDLISYPENFKLSAIVPTSSNPVQYSNETILGVDHWVKEESSKVMFIYGEFDPWSAAKFDLGASVNRDNFLFVAPGGNHKSSIAALASEDKAKAIGILRRWLSTSFSLTGSSDPIQINEPTADTKNRDEDIGLRP
jgi:hypothetical protein